MTSRRSPGVASQSAIAPVLGTAAPAIESFTSLVRLIVESRQKLARQQTERARIGAAAQVQLARIGAQQACMQSVLDVVFAERRETIRGLFAHLDDARRRNDADGAARALDAIVHVACSSPFAALRDAASAHHALQDPDATWEF
jgi:hypothetical protein